jgi:mycofactocin glycosyltransferase
MESTSAPAPVDLRLSRDAGTRLVANRSVLVGGSPVRVLRLTPTGERQVTNWFAGAPVPGSAAARALARRLLDAGIAHPDWPASPGSGAVPGPGDVTVVIPVRDRHAELARCLGGLLAPDNSKRRDNGPIHTPGVSCDPAIHAPGPSCRPQVIVVDDASADPQAIAAIAAAHGARVIHRPVNGGPGAARNSGLAAASTAFVAFLDSDCVPASGWLDRLLPHFADPAVGAVAPRIVPHEAGTSWLARYEGASSTLDMGARPSIVRPGARVSYVPGAALVVRAVAAGDGFAGGLFVGEDVDFIWRMSAAGWRVRYEPAAVMGHDHRIRFRAWFSRRTDYGTSAAVLERLHPGSVRPLYASWWTVGAWAAALSGRPVTATALTAAATALLARRLSRVTGERWPLPVPPHPVPPQPVPQHPSSDNSKKRSAPNRWSAGTRMIMEDLHAYSVLFFHQEKGLHDHGPAHPNNGNKRSAQDGDTDNSNKRQAHGGSADERAHVGPADNSRHVGPADDSRKRETGADAWRLAARLAGGGTVAAGRPLGSAISRTWWPLAIPAAIAFPKLRRPVAALILAPPLLDWADRRPPLDPARYVAARLLDDVAYSLGVWQGCLTRRTIRPLLPALGNRRPRPVAPSTRPGGAGG